MQHIVKCMLDIKVNQTATISSVSVLKKNVPGRLSEKKILNNV